MWAGRLADVGCSHHDLVALRGDRLLVYSLAEISIDLNDFLDAHMRRQNVFSESSAWKECYAQCIETIHHVAQHGGCSSYWNAMCTLSCSVNRKSSRKSIEKLFQRSCEFCQNYERPVHKKWRKYRWLNNNRQFSTITLASLGNFKWFWEPRIFHYKGRILLQNDKI